MEDNCEEERFCLQNLEPAVDTIFGPPIISPDRLDYLTSIKIIVVLWNSKDMREELSFIAYEILNSLSSLRSSEIWKPIHRKIVKEINNLNLPKIICKQLCAINSYVSKSLLYWLLLTYITFFKHFENMKLLTCKSYFHTVLNMFWNALCQANFYEMKFCNNFDTCSKFQEAFLALWSNVPPSLENRIYQNAERTAMILYFLPWNIGLHVTLKTINNIADSQRKAVITSKYGHMKCVYFIKHNEWQFYNLYTSLMLPNKDEIFEFKKYLIRKEGLYTATYFFKNKVIKNGKEYLKFCHKMENELTDRNFFFSYFIKHEHWDLLEIYLNFFYDEEEIYTVKKKLLKELGIRVIEKFIETTSWSSQKIFLERFFENENKFETYYKELLKCYFQCSVSVNFELFNYFLKWSVEPSKLDLSDDDTAFFVNIIMGSFIDLNSEMFDELLETVFQGDGNKIFEFKKIINNKGQSKSFIVGIL